MMQTNLSASVGKRTESLLQLRCMVELTDGVHKQLIFIAGINIFLSITAFLGNTLILVALYKENSLHPPSKLLYRCLATTDLWVGLIAEPFQVAYIFSLVQGDWKLCRLAIATAFVTGFSLSSVSLSTMTAISVDRLLALSLGVRYRQVVTLKRTYVLVIILWFKSMVVGTLFFINYRIAVWNRYIIGPLCLVTSAISYTKIFWTLYHNQNRVQAHVLQQPSQPSPLNMARYRRAVYSAMWVQLVLVVCYLPFAIAAAVLPSDRLSSSEFIVWTYTVTLIRLNSSLNPLLYCRNISGVRQAVKEIIRHALCCPRE